MSTEYTRRVAEFIVGTDTADISAEAKVAAVRPIIDSVGAILLGSASDAGAVAITYADSIVPAGAKRLWSGLPEGLPPDTLALLTSTLGHGLDYDDELAGTGHPSAIQVSAILSLPVEVSGEAMIDAYVMGVETNVKVANVMSNFHYWRGWHTTSTVGGYGSVAAAARLLKLNVKQTEYALGIVASLAAGLRRSFGTMTKPLHSGIAARNGVLAAMLAAVGFDACPDIFDGTNSFFDIYAMGDEDFTAFDRLGNPWAVVKPGLSLKKYPLCYATHRPIDAVLKLMAENGITSDQIAKIFDRAPTKGLSPLIYHNPQTGLEAKFSMEYALAAAAVDGQVTLASFEDEAVLRPAVRRMMALVEAVEDPRCRPEDPEARRSGAGTGGFHEVTITTVDGKEFTKVVEHPTGSPYHPLSWEESSAKWDECLRVGGKDLVKGAALLEQLRDLPNIPDVRAVLATMAA